MAELVNLRAFPVLNVLDVLLQDKTTKENIFWATDTYAAYGEAYTEQALITRANLTAADAPPIIPRTAKTADDQSDRTKKKAEVFTPAWICNKMNNACDEDWFGRKDVFTIEGEAAWQATEAPVPFAKPKDWQKYVDSRRLEITCGEAPFLASRYDAATGEMIPLKERIGILDRKMRVVNENATDEDEWLKWSYRALQSVYGYEWQGDNLLLARANLLLTFTEYYEARLQRKPTDKELKKAANIIAWNCWQMDGLTCTIPYAVPEEEKADVIIEDDDWAAIFGTPEEEQPKNIKPICRIWDWRRENAMPFTELKRRQEK